MTFHSLYRLESRGLLAWRVMQPLLDAPPPVHPYEKGSWGPPAADHLLAGHGRWHAPWVSA
jgi:glucose-6-phosphate 1-dehydrogenase